MIKLAARKYFSFYHTGDMSYSIFRLNVSTPRNIFIEQVKMLYSNILISIVGTLLTALICTWLLSNSVSGVTLIVWFGVHLLTALLRGIMYRHFLAAIQKEDTFAPQFWAWSYGFTALFSGMTWGSLPWLAMDTSSLMSTLVVSFAISGMITSSIAATAVFLPVFLMFSMPAGMLLGVRFLAEGGILAELSSLFFLFLGAGIFFAISVNHIFRQSIVQRFERDTLLVDVEEKRKEAEHANRDKSLFLASASHDLRQPLHALDLYLSSMEIEKDLVKQANLLNKARASSEALGGLLSTLLDISHMDSKDTQLQLEAMSLQPLFKACVNEFIPIACETGSLLKMRDPRDLCVTTDPMLFGRMLRNLVSNAVRYSASGKVLIAARVRAEFVRIEVWDTGQGIASEDLEDVFSEFYQLGNPERNREKGLGLGLAIVRRLSLLLNHPVNVCSVLGKGSCFSILLPACAPIVVDNGDAEELDISGMFVLLIDDDDLILDAMRGWLRLRACEVVTAGSCAEMLDKLENGDYPLPDAMIVDYRLRGGKTGLEAVSAIRDYYREMLPAMVVSGDTSKDVVEAVNAADCQFLAKPVSEALLVRTLSTF